MCTTNVILINGLNKLKTILQTSILLDGSLAWANAARYS